MNVIHRTTCTYQGETLYVLGAVPAGHPGVLDWETTRRLAADEHFRRFFAGREPSEQAVVEARRSFPRAAILERWHASLDYYVANDPDGADVLYGPIRFPASALEHQLVQRKFFPDMPVNIPHVLPAFDHRFRDASVDPYNAQVTTSRDPWVVAKWWAWFHLDFPRDNYARMYRKNPDGTRQFYEHAQQREMGDFVFNVALGRMNELAENVNNNNPANSAFIVALWTGTETDDTMADLTTYAAIEANANLVESAATNYARKTLTDADIAGSTVDNTANTRSFDMADQTFSTLGPGTAISRFTLGYDSDTTGGTDSNIEPVAGYGVSITPNGGNVTFQVNASGLWVSSRV